MTKLKNEVIYLQGGLGNQLFQYAFYLTRNAKRDNAIIDYGRVAHDGQHGNVSIINLLSVVEEKYLVSDNIDLPFLIRDSFLSKCLRFFLRKFKIKNIFSSFYDYDAMSSLMSVGEKDRYIGYFQFVDSAISSKKIIEGNLEALYKNKLDDYSNSLSTKTGLHIRRGDFLASKDSKHTCIDLDVIKTTISKFNEGEIVIFSDDVGWCKDNLSEHKGIDFFCGESAVDDFLALSQCQNYVLSGSTFSWWAAFLFSSLETRVYLLRNAEIQFQSEVSNKNIGWKYMYV